MKIKNILSKVEKITNNNKSEILLASALCSFAATIYYTYKAGYKADKILKEYKKEKNNLNYTNKKEYDEKRKTIKRKTIKKLLPIAFPPVISGISTILLVVGSYKNLNKKIAALSTVYSISESTIKNLNNKMNEVLGEKKTNSIKDSIINDKIKKDSITKKEDILLVEGDGNVLCKDLYSGRYFRSNSQRIKESICNISSEIIQETYATLNDFYELIGLEKTVMGDDLGWNMDDTKNGIVDIRLSSHLTNDGIPCLCIDYDTLPRPI